MLRLVALVPFAAMAACTTTTGSQEPPSITEGQCTAEGMDDLIGQAGTSELAGDALRRSGAKTVRWLRPGMAVTMEFRADRLNIHLDEQSQVSRITCG